MTRLDLIYLECVLIAAVALAGFAMLVAFRLGGQVLRLRRELMTYRHAWRHRGPGELPTRRGR